MHYHYLITVALPMKDTTALHCTQRLTHNVVAFPTPQAFCDWAYERYRREQGTVQPQLRALIPEPGRETICFKFTMPCILQRSEYYAVEKAWQQDYPGCTVDIVEVDVTGRPVDRRLGECGPAALPFPWRPDVDAARDALRKPQSDDS